MVDSAVPRVLVAQSIVGREGLPNAMVDVRGDEHQPANKHTVFTAMCMLVTTNCPMLLYKIIYWPVMQADALPWLLHLVADIHQPLHVGLDGDEGGNKVEIENPFNKRLPFTNVHTYWDDLPGPPWLRGKRLACGG